jgi:hypothetical protein
MNEFMRINSPEEYQDMLHAQSLRDGNRSPADEMRLRGLQSVYSRPDKAAGRLIAADVMHGKDIQNIFEEQGIPVRSSVERDGERNVEALMDMDIDDEALERAVRSLGGF